jgi:phosphoesterase RecJ-like protein
MPTPFGSTIAFALWLRACGKEVASYNEEGATSKFHYLPSHELVSLPPETPQKFDVFVALDTSVKNRLGTVLQAIAPGTPILNIDHHISNENFGDVNYIDPSAPATGQILLEFFQHVGATISPKWPQISLPLFRRTPVHSSMPERMSAPSRLLPA